MVKIHGSIKYYDPVKPPKGEKKTEKPKKKGGKTDGKRK